MISEATDLHEFHSGQTKMWYYTRSNHYVVEMLCMPRIRLQTPAQINMQKTQQKQPRCFVTILTHASALFHMLNVRHDAMCLWTSAVTPVRGSLETFDERGIFCSHRSK